MVSLLDVDIIDYTGGSRLVSGRACGAGWRGVIILSGQVSSRLPPGRILGHRTHTRPHYYTDTD